MKRVFGITELIFDCVYLTLVSAIGIFLLAEGKGTMGIMALILAFGDGFHLVPRMAVIFGKKEEKFAKALGMGKAVTSITMTIFYVLLWRLAQELVSSPPFIADLCFYLLAVIRILLCLLPQNHWKDRYPPVKWGIIRNIPFFIMGGLTAVRFFLLKPYLDSLGFVYLAVSLSFLFYFPVVLWSNRSPKIGMLMLPKTVMYAWIIVMCASY